MEMVTTIGYHGTSYEVGTSILTQNFNVSVGDHHWLGNGVYFFENGIGKPAIDHAREWAIASAWCKVKKKNTYDQFSVVKATICLTKLWDLSSPEGLRNFNYVRDDILSRLTSVKVGPRGIDNEIIATAARKMRFDGIRCPFYIQTSRAVRKIRLFSGIPNTLVLCVIDPSGSISLDDLVMIAEGRVVR